MTARRIMKHKGSYKKLIAEVKRKMQKVKMPDYLEDLIDKLDPPKIQSIERAELQYYNVGDGDRDFEGEGDLGEGEGGGGHGGDVR